MNVRPPCQYRSSRETKAAGGSDIKRLVKRSIYLVVCALYRIAPSYVRGVINEQLKVLNSLQQPPIAAVSPTKSRETTFEGIMIDSIEVTPKNELEIMTKLITSYSAAKEQQPFAARPYLPGAEWKIVLDTGWQVYRDAIARNDVKLLAQMLRNFFRNEALSGFWGPYDMFTSFCDLEGDACTSRADLMIAQFEEWRSLLPTTPLEELDAPRIGNPWGYVFGGKVLYEPVFEYHYQAHYFQSLLAHVETPIVLEIGGGFGGLAYHILKRTPVVKYIGLDLPENILLQAYYLSCAFPGARILTFSKEITMLDLKTINAYDIILMPNFMMPQIASCTADLIVNVRSLSEMPSETIDEYIHQIDRIGRLWFFHENIFTARTDGWFGIPSADFPKPINHVLVAASKSRWPRYRVQTSYPCQENLYLHRNVLEAHTVQ